MKKRRFWFGIILLGCFLIWTLLIRCIDVQPIGPGNSSVGFAALNGWFHRLTGVHFLLYTLTDWLGFVPVAVCIGFGACGIILAEINRTRAARGSAAFGIVLSVLGSAVFIAARQPYAALLYFVLLVVKGLLLLRTKS